MRANDSIASTVMPGFALRRARMLAAYWVLLRPDLGSRILDSAIAENASLRMNQETAEFYALFGRPDSARAIVKARAVPLRRLGYNKGTDTIAAYGAIDLAEGRPRDAAEKFRAAVSTAGGDAPSQITRDPEIGLALESAGTKDLAIARYEHFLTGPPRLEFDAFKLVWVLEHVASLYEEKDDRKKARAAYMRIAELWKNADPELQPRVARARERAAALR
jgi:tetratricopeptide (TPR) repeat protein